MVLGSNPSRRTEIAGFFIIQMLQWNMSNEDNIDYETVEIPSYLMERVRDNCEDYGFPTSEGFIQHAIELMLHDDPDASEEKIEKLLESRRQVNNGETIPMEEVLEDLDID